MQKILKPFRIAFMIVIPIFLSAACLIALYDLQILNGAAYFEESQNSIITNETVAASRGSILDRYGRLLVSNRISYNVEINRSDLVQSEDPNGILLNLVRHAEDLGIGYMDTAPISFTFPFTFSPEMTSSQANLLNDYIAHFKLDPGITAEELMAYFKQHYAIPDIFSDEDLRIAAGIRYELELQELFNLQPYYFASDISIDFISVIEEGKYPGVSIAAVPVREYHTDYAAHILGRIGPIYKDEYEHYKALGYPINALVGKDGLEAVFEPYLRGVDGERATTTNSNGIVTNVLYTKDPKPGNNVVLTLDIECQQVAEDALKSTIDSINAGRQENQELAKGGAVVVLDINNWDVLASASYPTYQLASFSKDYSDLLLNPMDPLFNRAIQGTYSPGSTFKMVTAIAALNEKIITTETKIHDDGIYTEYKGEHPRCWIFPGSHGTINVIKALEVSCNYFFYFIGDRTGIDNISKYASQFGLGQSTGIELDEYLGTLATREYKEENFHESWYGGNTLQAAIGQSYNLFTPMQIASYCATIANDGKRYSAHFLRSIMSHDSSETVYTYAPELLSTVQAEPEYFSAIKLGMLNVSKYGTSSSAFSSYAVEVASKTGTVQLGDDVENNAIFIAYAPYDDPQIAVAVVVESGGAGSAVTQIAKSVFDYYFSSKNAGNNQAAENQLLP
ncbi:MAG: penicillin-binding protein [Clostridiales bacterium]|nr:penicillin-binding protein [Clostridiales bacterium]